MHKVNNLHNTDMTDVIPAFVIFKNYLNIKNFYNLTNYIEKLVKKFFSPIFYGTFFTAPFYNKRKIYREYFFIAKLYYFNYSIYTATTAGAFATLEVTV